MVRRGATVTAKASDETPWHKSSHSGSSGSCVEVAEVESATSDWAKSTHSTGANECLEVRGDAIRMDMRDSQHPHLGHLGFSAPEWAAFLRAACTDGL
ncbi:DUF397 domain-containing protein [Nocardiopsis sp. RSe5-2]|uniref:DUF397 domain-containing protein n=1 Tax=Nocardiopsis endophytica TaxID=3018445 RepID=A0ABT4U500_9ACTN|nr:DUF397 domain-containing protein [Nocardiopsis endophytica]MDA2812019.1 DUF397 domain-containing protein [Nocardiopsis endophytica]